jgi:thymidylate kinase
LTPEQRERHGAAIEFVRAERTEGPRFGDLLAALDGSSISYRLLRPSTDGAVESDELDVLVWPQHRRAFRKLAAAHGFRRLRFRSTGKEVLGRLTHDGILYLDVHYAFIQNGLVYRQLEALTGRVARTPAGHQTLTAEDLFLHLYFHNLLGKKGVQPKDLGTIQALLTGSLDRAYLAAQFDDDTRPAFDMFCAEPAAFAQGSPRGAQAAAEMARRMRRATPVRDFWRAVRRRLLPGGRRGIHVAFIGVDGCGKSTTTGRTTELLAAGKLRSRLVYMGPWGQVRSGVLKKALRWGCFPQKGTPASAARRISGWVKGVVYYVAVFVELWERFLTDVRPAVNRGHVVLSDRYIYDLRYLYKKRRVEGFAWLRRAVCAWFPAPDLVVFLHNDPHAIAARKAQLTPAEIDEFQQLYARALKPYRVLAIKTDVDPDDVAARIVRQARAIYFERNVAH